MKLFKNQLDEMQENKLLHIEKHGFWLAFWSLFIAIMVESFLGFDFKEMAGEWMIFTLIAIYALIECIRNGIWDRHLKANKKTNCFVSLIAGIFVGIYSVISSMFEYSTTVVSDILIFLISFLTTFILAFVILQICSLLYKKRRKKLEEDPEDDLL